MRSLACDTILRVLVKGHAHSSVIEVYLIPERVILIYASHLIINWFDSRSGIRVVQAYIVSTQDAVSRLRLSCRNNRNTIEVWNSEFFIRVELFEHSSAVVDKQTSS